MSQPEDKSVSAQQPSFRQPWRSRLYFSTVMHHRVKPVQHRFTYRVGTFLLDLAELPTLDHKLTGFGYNRPSLYSLYDRDYVTTPGDTLQQHVSRLLQQNGCAPAHRVELLCMPRMLGYSFNPLSIFFCYDASDRLYCTLYQVSNTFNQKHIYAVEAQPVSVTPAAGLRHQADKVFYVSPFIDMACQYRFRLTQPSDILKVLIRQEDSEGLLLNATLTGRAAPLTSRELIRLAVTRPLFTYKVIAGIHWEALRLWLKKVPLVSRKGVCEPPLVTKGRPLVIRSHEE